jgi:hypothetical protein
MPSWYHLTVAKRTINRRETETVKLTYDQLETCLVALAIRQEELRGARSAETQAELSHIWDVSNQMDVAQRSLEGRMSRQVEGWLRSVTEKSGRRPAIRPKKSGRRPTIHPDLLERLSRLFRL